MDFTMMGIRMMLTKDSFGGLKLKIGSKLSYEKYSFKAEIIQIAIRMEKSLQDDDSSLMTRQVAPHVVIRSTISNLASYFTMTIPSVDLECELKSIMETLDEFYHLKINVVQLCKKNNQNVGRSFRVYENYTQRGNPPPLNFFVLLVAVISFNETILNLDQVLTLDEGQNIAVKNEMLNHNGHTQSVPAKT